MTLHQDAKTVHDFWFTEHGPDDWFAGKPEFDALIAERFADLHERVRQGEAWTWRDTAEGRVAEIVVLDQFSRQLFRRQPKAFAQDPMALALAQEAVAQGLDKTLSKDEVTFLYLPYMHSESALIHEEAMRLYTGLGDADLLEYEVKHAAAINRFGRYPFRNAALGRASTQEEEDYMREAGTRGF